MNGSGLPASIPPILLTLAAILVSFAAGSIPSAYIAVRMGLGKDIRALGSGNVGTTNAFRSLGLPAALLVFAVDFSKGAVPVALALGFGNRFLPGDSLPAVLCGTAAVLGHTFTPWLGFHGGKGVATGAGVATALFPPLFPACLAIFAITLAVARIMSVASLATALALPAVYLLITALTGSGRDIEILLFFTAAAAFIGITHRRNIRSLMKGTEKKLF